MNCRKVRPLLGAFLCDELAPDARERILTHIASCSRCSEEVKSLERVKEIVAIPALSTEEPQSMKRLLASLSRSPRRVPYPAFAWAGATAVAVAVALLIGVQVTFADGSLIVAIGRGRPARPEAVTVDQVYAVSRAVTGEELEKQVLPAILALSDKVDASYLRQNQELQAVADDLELRWQARFLTMLADVDELYRMGTRAIYERVFETNRVVNRLVTALQEPDGSAQPKEGQNAT